MLKNLFLLLVIVHTVFSQQCQSGYYLDPRINQCFKVSTDGQNYVGAIVSCNREGGFLATIGNSFVNSFIGSQLVSEKSYYIGLNSLMQNDWTWVDGTPYAYSNWAPGQSQGGQCATIQGTTNLWGNPNCSIKLPYICMTEPVGQIIQPTHRHALCETGWTYFNETDSCYRTFTGSRSTHADAEANCVEGSGGHLASIHSIDELYFVSELSATGIAQAGLNQVLIGLLLVNNAWTWTDGTPVDYQKWSPNHPAPGQPYAYLVADESTDFKNGRFFFDTYGNPTITFRAFVCKKTSLP